MAETFVPQCTAGIQPEKFAGDIFFANDRRITLTVLGVFILIGFGLRMHQLGAESLGEDEFNKLETVREYRANGLSGKNGEHPFLMKGLQTVSTSAAEKINAVTGTSISEEGALRFPIALFGTFTALLIFLLARELFGPGIGLIAGILWAVEPMAIGFDRIAKEDSLALFFFLLMNFCWIRSQSKAERGEKGWLRYVWIAAAAFGALMASKYYPFLLGIPAAYYILFQHLPGNQWALGRMRWLKFMIIMGVAFLVLNPTILFPGTWKEMLNFSSEGRIGHDSYEYMGVLYRHKLSLWLYGVPWTFYYIFIAVKTSLTTLVLLMIGLPLVFLHRLGDGRYLIGIWAFMWFMPYSVLGGKFTRYFTMAEPIILIVAAVGLYFTIKWLTSLVGKERSLTPVLQAAVLLVAVAFPLYASIAATPHFRLFTNSIGTHFAETGDYFPHDEVYDGSTREALQAIAGGSPAGVTVASETPGLVDYYAKEVDRTDIRSVLLSDKNALAQLKAGDVILETTGRRYFSNTDLLERLRSEPHTDIKMGTAVSNRIYRVDATTLPWIVQAARE